MSAQPAAMASAGAAAGLRRSDVSRAALLALGVLAAILSAYHESLWSMVGTWMRSDTYTHGFIILPISAWLIWRRRGILATLPRRPDAMAMIVLAMLGFGWLLATVASVEVAGQYFMMAMLPVTVWAILGGEVTWAIAFPLAYLLLAVPFGDIFIAPLISFTADFTVYALQLTGIPVYREGNYFSIPSGNWSVVEACSGLRYLIASFTLGTLYAYLTYHSLKRRLVFIAFSIIAPIIANGIRAYLIVMIGHLSDMRLAAGVDHLIYGWIFFGFVILLMFWIGSFWQERGNPGAGISRSASPHAGSAPLRRIAGAAGSCIAIALAWPAWAAWLESRPVSDGQVEIAIPGVPGQWETSGETGASPAFDWSPIYTGSPALFRQTYRNGDRSVRVYIAYYRNQRPGSELINSGNLLVSEKDLAWHVVSEDARRISLGDTGQAVTQNRLHSPSARLLAWRWYWPGDGDTTNPYWVKAMLAKNKLLGRSDAMAEIIVVTSHHGDEKEAVAVLQEFLGAMLPAIKKGIAHAGDH